MLPGAGWIWMVAGDLEARDLSLLAKYSNRQGALGHISNRLAIAVAVEGRFCLTIGGGQRKPAPTSDVLTASTIAVSFVMGVQDRRLTCAA
jgi:hypothetical protein